MPPHEEPNMTRVLLLALPILSAAAVLATFGLRQGAEIVAAVALVAGFAFAIVVLRHRLTRGCYERSADDSLPGVKPRAQVTHKRRAA